MAPHLCVGFSANSAEEWIQGGAKNRSMRGPFSKGLFSSDWKATTTNPMHGSDLKAYRKKHSYFWLHTEVKKSTHF